MPLTLIVVKYTRITDLRASFDKGADASAIFNTASLLGFGAVIAALPAFGAIREEMLGIGGGNPAISIALALDLLFAMLASAPGDMSIALDFLGDTYAVAVVIPIISLVALLTPASFIGAF